MTGRKPFAPTEGQRRMVRAMAGFGVPHDDIALVVRCSPPTLRKRFRHELDVATIEANTRVAQTLYQQATTPGNIAATINLAIQYVSSEPLSESEWMDAHGDKSTTNEAQPLLPSYKKEGR